MHFLQSTSLLVLPLLFTAATAKTEGFLWPVVNGTERGCLDLYAQWTTNSDNCGTFTATKATAEGPGKFRFHLQGRPCGSWGTQFGCEPATVNQVFERDGEFLSNPGSDDEEGKFTYYAKGLPPSTYWGSIPVNENPKKGDPIQIKFKEF